MDETQARAEISRIGASLFSRGYVHGTTGNISVRLSQGHLITPTDACLGELDPDRLALIGPDGTQLNGLRASKAIALHRNIYDADPDAQCIIHTHSREAVIASFEPREPDADLLPPITPYQVMKVGSTPTIPYSTPGSPATAAHVARLLAARREAGRPVRSIMLARLGPTVWGPTPSAAMAATEELEETALIWNRLCPGPLPDADIADLAARFGISW